MDVSKAAGSAFNELARVKISEVSPFWPASKIEGRTVERIMAPVFMFIVLQSICFLGLLYVVVLEVHERRIESKKGFWGGRNLLNGANA
jgi:hypothetical protein